tara:strand:+ start:119 stop:223 length:105 start_codon:yes stop_codon:yes gene_type:complete
MLVWSLVKVFFDRQTKKGGLAKPANPRLDLFEIG